MDPAVPHNLAIAVLFLAFAAPLFAQTGSISGTNGTSLQALGLFDSMFPMIPSAGLSLEF